MVPSLPLYSTRGGEKIIQKRRNDVENTYIATRVYACGFRRIYADTHTYRNGGKNPSRQPTYLPNRERCGLLCVLGGKIVYLCTCAVIHVHTCACGTRTCEARCESCTGTRRSRERVTKFTCARARANPSFIAV